MKVLLVSFHHVEYAIELANALGKNNEVHLILSGNRVDRTVGSRLSEIISDTVSYTLITKKSLWSLSWWKNIFYLIKTVVLSKHDVVHLQESGSPYNLFFLLFSRMPVIVTVHDVLLHPGSDADIQKDPELRVRRKLIKCCYNRVIVHGERLRETFIEEYGKPAVDVFSVPHGCLFSFLPGNPSPQQEEEPHTVLFFGRMEKYKGLSCLMDAEPLVSREVPAFKIIIAGTGSDLILHKAALSSNPHFEVHDRFIPNEEVPSFFRRASLVVLPYIEASQSGVAAMAYAFGKPVIASDLGSLSEVVRDGRTGIIVPPWEPERFASAIMELLQNADRRREMGSAALKLAETDLGWEHIASLTVQVYKHSLN